MKQNQSLTAFDIFTFWFVVIDNLFLPYFWLKTVSYSLPVVFLWYFVRTPHLKEYRTSQNVILILSTISTIFGCVLYPKYASDNIVLLINLFLAIFSFQLFSYVRQRDQIDGKIARCLYYFVIVVFLWALIFYFNSGLYETIRHIFNMRIEESTTDVLAGSIRYGYYWEDENNIAYIVCAVVIFLLVSNHFNLIKKSLLVVMTAAIVVATMSSGGLICFALTALIFLLSLYSGVKKSRFKFVYFIAIIAFLALIGYAFSFIYNSEIYELMQLRMEGKNDAGDNRTVIYQNILSNFEWWKHIIWGYGGRTIVAGVYHSTHNGLLHLTIAYGFIVCFLYTKMYFFKNRKQQYKFWLWRIPIFIGFMVNIMITDDKIHTIMMMLLAFELTRLKPGIELIKR